MKDIRNAKIFNIIIWTFSIIAMPVIAIPSLIGMLISKKLSKVLLKHYFGVTEDMEEL